jgi:hypothetical protein
MLKIKSKPFSPPELQLHQDIFTHISEQKETIFFIWYLSPWKGIAVATPRMCVKKSTKYFLSLQLSEQFAASQLAHKILGLLDLLQIHHNHPLVLRKSMIPNPKHILQENIASLQRVPKAMTLLGIEKQQKWFLSSSIFQARVFQQMVNPS